MGRTRHRKDKLTREDYDKPPTPLDSYPARVEVERTVLIGRIANNKVQSYAPGFRISVYRTDRQHPHSLMFSFHYTEETRKQTTILVFVYEALRPALDRLWDATFGKLRRKVSRKHIKATAVKRRGLFD